VQEIDGLNSYFVEVLICFRQLADIRIQFYSFDLATCLGDLRRRNEKSLPPRVLEVVSLLL